MPKISAVLSNRVYDQFMAWLEEYDGGNYGTIVEAAVIKFAEVPDAERRRLVKRVATEKLARGRSGWIGLFWDAYAEEFGESNFDPGNQRAPYAVRSYEYFDCIMLVHPGELESDHRDFDIHVTESPPTVSGVETLTRRFRFTSDDSPYAAASEVAAWVREQHPRAVELRAERQALINGLRPSKGHAV